ncbi:MAG: hypothetical protein H0U59_05420 [Gemmatimonadaceae bacterium]|nr:hypothetical protein [Gemmatimonadaceae bacterium]
MTWICQLPIPRARRSRSRAKVTTTASELAARLAEKKTLTARAVAIPPLGPEAAVQSQAQRRERPEVRVEVRATEGA